MAAQLVADLHSSSSSLPRLFDSSQVITDLVICDCATLPFIRSRWQPLDLFVRAACFTQALALIRTCDSGRR
jgi:hypothetical protein